ncbi:MAG: MauE/DoxX family redox-associated membrane protein [Flavipsychrobacter sp.]
MADSIQAEKNTPFYIKRITGIILLLALAAVFLFSAYSKLWDSNAFDEFRWTFLDLGINSVKTAGVIARTMIGLEFMIGLFLLCHIFLRSFTYPLTIVVLLFFIGYLVFVLVERGNTGSCGCFGNKVQVSPLSGILKNVLMLGAVIALIYIYPIKPYKNQEWLAGIIGMVALVLPFVLVPLNTDVTAPEPASEPINLSILYSEKAPPKEELRTGKHIVAFMSLTCPHCRKAAYLLHIIHHQHPEIPIYLVLDGNVAHEKDFFESTHAADVPHMHIGSTNDFLLLAGPAVPAIFWVNNSVIERKATYYQLDPKQMEDWLKQ